MKETTAFAEKFAYPISFANHTDDVVMLKDFGVDIAALTGGSLTIEVCQMLQL